MYKVDATLKYKHSDQQRSNQNRQQASDGASTSSKGPDRYNEYINNEPVFSDERHPNQGLNTMMGGLNSYSGQVPPASIFIGQTQYSHSPYSNNEPNMVESSFMNQHYGTHQTADDYTLDEETTEVSSTNIKNN